MVECELSLGSRKESKKVGLQSRDRTISNTGPQKMLTPLYKPPPLIISRTCVEQANAHDMKFPLAFLDYNKIVE